MERIQGESVEQLLEDCEEDPVEMERITGIVAHCLSDMVRIPVPAEFLEPTGPTGPAEPAELVKSSRPRHYVDTTAVSIAALRGQLLFYALDRKGDAAGNIIEVLFLLLERGAPLNMTMYADDPPSLGMYCFMDFGTPLHKAVDAAKLEIVKFLLAQGANMSILSSETKPTALQWAEKKGHEDVVAVLRSPDQHQLQVGAVAERKRCRPVKAL
ncbi:hypothetical protein Sste5346_004801 [Sporothrix stenoceras]|uniref:Ankyrin repeat protein n=1 Tax=Sporothrix stenoceras TaxID=5173 RepID=A0ABR3Z764_9PEZI